jgi:hypothetical protein
LRKESTGLSANDVDFREVPTLEFLSAGLGSKLTRNAEILMWHVRFGDRQLETPQLASFACASIAERVLWLIYGIWMGHFKSNSLPELLSESDPPLVSEAERRFLRDYASALKDAGMPSQIQELCDWLARNEHSADALSFLPERSSLFPLRRRVPDWYPVFQVTLIISELLNEPTVTSFFSFSTVSRSKISRRRHPLRMTFFLLCITTTMM